MAKKIFENRDVRISKQQSLDNFALFQFFTKILFLERSTILSFCEMKPTLLNYRD
jgi:hypothetical protein